MFRKMQSTIRLKMLSLESGLYIGPNRSHEMNCRAYAATMVILLLFSLNILSSCSGSGDSSQQDVSSPDSGITHGSVSASSESSGDSSTAEIAVASSMNAKNSMAIADSELGQDSTGRYYIKGAITNGSENTCDVSFEVKLTVRDSDKSGKEHATKSNVSRADSDTPWLTTEGDSFTALSLESGESREITIYPEKVGDYLMSNGQVVIEAPEFTVTHAIATKTQGNIKGIPDIDGNLSLEILSFNGDRLSGSVVNNTGKYVSSAELNFVTYDSDNTPIVQSASSNNRPVGVKVVTEKVNNIEPNKSVDFDIKLGDCADYRLRDAFYDIDQSKS